jgi:hypothetical protein
MKLITAEETKGVGVQWSNLFNRTEPGNAMVNDPDQIIFFFFCEIFIVTIQQKVMGLVWIMFLASSLLYWIVTWYMDNIKPGEYGVPKKWYFIFQVLLLI